jgi:hypothetical protein
MTAAAVGWDGRTGSMLSARCRRTGSDAEPGTPGIHRPGCLARRSSGDRPTRRLLSAAHAVLSVESGRARIAAEQCTGLLRPRGRPEREVLWTTERPCWKLEIDLIGAAKSVIRRAGHSHCARYLGIAPPVTRSRPTTNVRVTTFFEFDRLTVYTLIVSATSPAR